jgi:hypothetical protein
MAAARRAPLTKNLREEARARRFESDGRVGGFLASRARARSSRAAEAAGPSAAVLYYRDPMHPTYTSDRPGQGSGLRHGPGARLRRRRSDRLRRGSTGRREPCSSTANGSGLGVRPAGRDVAHAGTLRASAASRWTRTASSPFAPAATAGCAGSIRAPPPGAPSEGKPLASVYGRDYTTAQRSFLYALRASENPPPALPETTPTSRRLTLKEAGCFSQNLGSARRRSPSSRRLASDPRRLPDLAGRRRHRRPGTLSHSSASTGTSSCSGSPTWARLDHRGLWWATSRPPIPPGTTARVSLADGRDHGTSGDA